jgi:hypothetical protein
MARLSEREKRELKAAARRTAPRPPAAPLRTPVDFLAFATFASQFKSAPKPVRFGGDHWKL